MTRAAFAWSFVLVISATALLEAANWPQWRGPNRNGISEETGLLTEWPEEGPKVLWQRDNLGGGFSTPAVVENRLYILGSSDLDNEFVQALDVDKNGEQIWQTRVGKVGEPDQRPPYPGARSTPTVDGERLYALGSDGDLLCLSAEDGETIWAKNLRTDFGGTPGEWAYSESPLVDGDVLVVTPGGSEATMAALDKTTGEPIWKAAVEGGDEAGYSSVVISNAGGVKQYVQFLGKGVAGVDAATGKVLWRYDRTAQGSPANIPTPLVHEDYIYTASGRGGGALIKLNKTNEGFVVEEMYHDSKFPKAIGGTVLVDGHIYGTSSDSLMCLELVSGDIKWRDRALGAASICVAQDQLYLHGENGEIALVDATPEEYREQGRFTPPGAPDRGGSKAWAYPVVADGKLFIYDTGTLWCFDILKP
ncbi:MAG TPA: PQQ-binding-like beta-propeller repeat protein [Lacipirellula sp.]